MCKEVVDKDMVAYKMNAALDRCKWRTIPSNRSSDSDAKSWIRIVSFWRWLSQVNLDLNQFVSKGHSGASDSSSRLDYVRVISTPIIIIIKHRCKNVPEKKIKNVKKR